MRFLALAFSFFSFFALTFFFGRLASCLSGGCTLGFFPSLRRRGVFDLLLAASLNPAGGVLPAS